MSNESYLEPTYNYSATDPTGTQLSLRHDLNLLFARINALLAITNYDSTRDFITIIGHRELVSPTVDTIIQFHLPTQATSIKKIIITCYGERYYAGVATASSSVVVPFKHTHTLNINASTSTAAKTVSYLSGNLVANLTASTTVTTNSAVNTVSHSHTSALSISQSTTPTGVMAYYHNGSSYDAGESWGNAPDTTTPWTIKTEYDVTGKFSGTGHKKIKLTSTRLGAFSYQIMMELEMQPTS